MVKEKRSNLNADNQQLNLARDLNCRYLVSAFEWSEKNGSNEVGRAHSLKELGKYQSMVRGTWMVSHSTLIIGTLCPRLWDCASVTRQSVLLIAQINLSFFKHISCSKYSSYCHKQISEQYYASRYEKRYSDWILQATWLILTNPIASFHDS